MAPSPRYLTRTDSPVGRIELTSDGEHLTGLSIARGGLLPHDGIADSLDDILRLARSQIDEYFAGSRREFDLPLQPMGTSFQRAVWKELAALRWGEYTSYGELGALVGRPGAARAIGGAVGANPLPIVIGCHRVLSSNGRVTGYSGGEGIPTKLWLLQHEGITLAA
jgi:methylated-DNA-[protein]-cysteine S-methyltransferase